MKNSFNHIFCIQIKFSESEQHDIKESFLMKYTHTLNVKRLTECTPNCQRETYTYTTPNICVNSVKAATKRAFCQQLGNKDGFYSINVGLCQLWLREREMEKATFGSLATSGLEQREGHKLFSDNSEFQPESNKTSAREFSLTLCLVKSWHTDS